MNTKVDPMNDPKDRTGNRFFWDLVVILMQVSKNPWNLNQNCTDFKETLRNNIGFNRHFKNFVSDSQRKSFRIYHSIWLRTLSGSLTGISEILLEIYLFAISKDAWKNFPRICSSKSLRTLELLPQVLLWFLLKLS